ncbi:hypothetical protein CSZ94_19175 [Janthinobacterium sp. ROICE36]|uniref:hypothetical protein n=1 Tax=Janthinobacterium sp. ROICE36 TaxID=2048670 RepID=UPI000C7F47C7|nr:hypothetical protein [Janthinobacterium sp. ROICE36]PLY40760.1 hypothetical protein CSZ94_19175 [Janthinobacterium sp. ROICE36]
MDTPARRYLICFCACVCLVLGSVSFMNYQVDPYLLHQWDSPLVQRLRPTYEKLAVWGKTYAVARYRPAVVYIGNSRTEMGLPASSMRTLFEGKSVFNSAVSGASIGDAILLAEHAARVSHVDTMVWGIHAPSFSMELGSAGVEPGLTDGGPAFFARRALLNIKRGLTVDMTRDTWRILSGSYDGACLSSLALHGQRDQSCITSRNHGWAGTARAFTPRLQEFGDGLGPTAPALRAFDASVGTLCRGGTRLRLYINPTHALTLAALYWRGKWDAMQQWQRDLAQMAGRYRRQGCDVRVIDFSGFNSITSEVIPQVSGARDMRYYWEASHYRDNVGHFILARLFGGAPRPPADFGVELTETGIVAHQAAMRAARERYHAQHADETAYLRHVLTLPREPK